jgi:Rps23 Pro-64 3,4-dihydroxylase Tpa1-like proline 4-hydroxylase
VSSFDLTTVRARMIDARRQFAEARPFPHVVFDDFLCPDAADALAAEFDRIDEGWTYYHHVNEKKRGLADVTRMGHAARAAIADLSSAAFIDALEILTGIDGLLPDADLDGGGLHETRAGGFLNVHTDFLAHTVRRTWSRQLNLLLFLNRDWPDAYGGALEFWDAEVTRCERRVAPLFNRCVVFATSAISFHGVPEPVACPPDRSRRSLALYYFRDEQRVQRLRPTRYVARPGDGVMRRALVHADVLALRAYAVLKRYTPLGDRIVSRLLRRF